MKRRDFLISTVSLTLPSLSKSEPVLAKPKPPTPLNGAENDTISLGIKLDSTGDRLRFSPGYILGNCTSIQREINMLEQQLNSKNKKETGKALKHRYKKQISLVKQQLNIAKRSAKKADFVLTVQSCETALTIIVTILGFAFTSTIVVGSLAAFSLLSGTLFLALRAINNSGTQDIIFGYTKNRTFTLGGLIAEESTKTVSKNVMAKLISIVSILNAIYDLIEASTTKDILKEKINELEHEINELHKSLSHFKTAKEWAALRFELLTGTIHSLKAFVEKNKKTNCSFTIDTRIPLIKP